MHLVERKGKERKLCQLKRAVFLFERHYWYIIPKSLSVLEPQPVPPSVWDILPKFGLPSGLLPDYVLHDDRRFIVMLDSPCYIQFDTWSTTKRPSLENWVMAPLPIWKAFRCSGSSCGLM
ncbi:hypothetical protein J1N35_040858 [Gossypium stocksii]|uniref:Uncharacterized protein n=1 Tax=Gossypium stocksii TaxID=47602 RepID=A0A9D3ZI39_9ROSI|nr:hypothetical protein J1N35_040858 [Gossypium stocksii]